MKAVRSAAGPGRQYPRLPGSASGWGKLFEIEDRIFTERRVRFFAAGVTAAWALVIGWLLLGGWAIRPNGHTGSIDFCWEWTSGKFAASRDPARIYDYSVFGAAEHAFFRPGECLFHYDYPPTFLFFSYPLGLMPYSTAFAVWVVATFLLYETAIYAITPRPTALLAAAAPVAVPLNVLLGHNGFLTAGLMGLSLVLMERRPWLSGILLGLLTYKPQFGVLFPLALMASRNWRALASATATSMTLGGAAAIAFGYRTWPSFIASLFDRDASLTPHAQVVLKLQSVYGLLHWAGAGVWVSWSAHLIVAGIVAATVCAIWAKPVPHSLKAAALCVGSVAVTPYVLGYDFCILSIAVAFLVSDGLARGFLPGERIVVLICFILVPFGPIIYFTLLFIITRRVVTYHRDFVAARREAARAPRLGRTP
jgi:hypothetical protein